MCEDAQRDVEATQALTAPLEALVRALDSHIQVHHEAWSPEERRGLAQVKRGLEGVLDDVRVRLADADVDPPWKPAKAQAPHVVCCLCGSDDVWYRVWRKNEAADFEAEYHCRLCGRRGCLTKKVALQVFGALP
jgi:hypothetical protein